MRTSIVPAQITTVEDKIAGNISINQAVILGIPVLFGFIAALLFPPSGQFVTYKVVIVAIIFVICGTLAMRIKGRIIAQWLILFAVYVARPKYYIYDKNSNFLREQRETVVDKNEEIHLLKQDKKPVIEMKELKPKEFARLQQIASEGKGGLRFEVGKKGELNVRITENE